MAKIEGATQLYRHFDADGKLLYVGVSLLSLTRVSEHKGLNKWFERIKNITIENFSTRGHALKAEILAIKTENPEFNIRHSNLNHVKKPTKNETCVKDVEAEIQMRDLIRKACGESQIAWAKKHGFSRQYVNQVINGKKPISDKIIAAAGYAQKINWVKKDGKR